MNLLFDHNITNAACCFRLIARADGRVYDFSAKALSASTSLANSLKNAGTSGAKDTVTNTFHLELPDLTPGDYDLQKYYLEKASVLATTVPDLVVPIFIGPGGELLAGSEQVATVKRWT